MITGATNLKYSSEYFGNVLVVSDVAMRRRMKLITLLNDIVWHVAKPSDGRYDPSGTRTGAVLGGLIFWRLMCPPLMYVLSI